jgi:hypothetical protein
MVETLAEGTVGPAADGRVQPRARGVSFLVLGLLWFSIPACHSPGGGHWGWREPPDSRNVAYRPAYELPGTRPVYLGGYAGADYGPLRPRRPRAGDRGPGLDPNPLGLTINQGSWQTE